MTPGAAGSTQEAHVQYQATPGNKSHKTISQSDWLMRM